MPILDNVSSLRRRRLSIFTFFNGFRPLIGLSQILACTEVSLALGREGELVLKIVFKSLVSRAQSGDHDREIYKPFIYLVLLLIYLWITLF